ncbi:MAG TPA: hypothetical protein VL997_01925 [Dyella sp.]|nr:hypothetical protein [Dyella sp.]
MSMLIRAWALLALMLMLSGCQSSMMTKAGNTSQVVVPSDATIVFMRPSSFGGAIQASVYDVTGGQTVFGGIVSSKTSVQMQVPAGEHLFMVIGENADFMNADLSAGKTYYVWVRPRMGVWKARFSLIPIHNDPQAKYNLQSSDFADWKRDSVPVVKNAGADTWYQQNKADIESKRLDYMKKWDRMDPQDKAELTLHASDGV